METQLIQIQKLKKFYLKILNNLDFGIIIVDKDWNIKFLNRYLKNFLKLKKSSARRNLFKTFSRKPHLKKLSKILKESIHKNKNQRKPTETTTKLIINDQTKYIKIKIFGTLFEEEEEEEEVLITITDITELEELNRSLILSGKFSILGTIGSGLAHEIKNPLTIIKGHLYLLKDKCSIYNDTELDHSFKIISKQSDRIQNIINLLLSFAKENNNKEFRVNLSEIIKKSISMCLPTAIKKRIRIINKVNRNIFIHGIEMELEELFLNLLLNSIDAINHNYGKIIINEIIMKKDKKNNIVITISDNGAGIPPEIVDKIFDPFFTTKEKGSGLGLSICYRIMKNHNGIIKIVSEPDEGTKVILKFPLINIGEDYA